MLVREDGKYNERMLEELILKIVRKKKPKTVKELAVHLRKTYKIPTEVTVDLVKELEKTGKLTLHKKSQLRPRTPPLTTPKLQLLLEYLRDPRATDFWAVLALVLITIGTVLLMPGNLYPVVILRWVLGSLFVLFLPGYALMGAIFPQKELDLIEQVGISFGLSLAISPLLGLILNFTPWGITLAPILICLALMTGFSMLIGAYRKTGVLKQE